MLKYSAQKIADELQRRDIEFEIIESSLGLMRYKKGNSWILLRSTTSPQTSLAGSLIADRKDVIGKLAEASGLRVPETNAYEKNIDIDSLLAIRKKLVVKPVSGAHGDGVSINITNKAQLYSAVAVAKRNDIGDGVLVQEQVEGVDVRVLIIGNKYAAAAIREPASVAGDGVATVHELIERENAENPDRGEGYAKKLNKISIEVAQRFIGEDINTYRPSLGEEVQVTGPANIGSGGKATDITDKLPEDVVAMAIEVSRSLGLPTCGVDFMAANVDDAESYYFIEVNTCPSLGLHIQPSVGKSRAVDELIVDYLIGEN